jgi:hypothetical protein
MRTIWRYSVFRVVVLGVALLGGFGCGRPAPKTFAVEGRVILPGVDLRQLAGGRVEVTLPSDRRVQAAGEIGEDGRFSLKTIHAGQPLIGAPQGEYQARIVLSDEDRGNRLRRGLPVARRFSNFKTSGLSVRIPPEGDVTLAVARK